MPTVAELRKTAKEMGLKGYSKMKKEELQEFIKKGKNNENLRKVFTEKVSRSKNEKIRMAKECPSCCGGIKSTGECSYPICKVNTCDENCEDIYKSAVAARITKNKSKQFSPREMESIIKHLDSKVKENGCSRRKSKK